MNADDLKVIFEYRYKQTVKKYTHRAMKLVAPAVVVSRLSLRPKRPIVGKQLASVP
jgi:hypothetical protein